VYEGNAFNDLLTSKNSNPFIK